MLLLGGLLACMVGIVGVAVVVERIARAPRPKNVLINLVVWPAQVFATQIFSASIAPGVTWLGGKIGNPPIHLPDKGWMLPVSVVLMLGIIDLIQYFFHRTMHRVPWLWAMHSLHHSDREMNATTSYRIFWLEKMLEAVSFIPLGFLIKLTFAQTLGVLVLGWVNVTFQHLNLRIGLPRFSWLLVTPQFHRMHHSIDEAHHNRNYSAFLPLWDVLFGTYLKPEGFPATGIAEGEPHGPFDALMWAFRKRSFD